MKVVGDKGKVGNKRVGGLYSGGKIDFVGGMHACQSMQLTTSSSLHLLAQVVMERGHS